MILAIAAFLVAGGAVYWEVSKTNRDVSEQSTLETQDNLYAFKEDEVSQLEVTPQKGITLKFQRTEAKFPETWKMTSPEAKIADEAAITFLLDQLVSSKSEKTVTVNKEEWSDFGITPDNPRTQVTLSNGTVHQILLGGETFDKKNLYAVVDQSLPFPEDVTVSIVPTTLLDAVQRPLKEWEYDPDDLPSVPATPKTNTRSKDDVRSPASKPEPAPAEPKKEATPASND